MDEVLKKIASGSESSIEASLSQFNSMNAANFSIGEDSGTRKEFCSTLLSYVGKKSPTTWAPKTIALALTALKIVTREREGIELLLSKEGLLQIMTLAELKETKVHFEGQDIQGKSEVIVEAVKCLCNILLNNRYLAGTLDQLGCMNAVLQRLNYCHKYELPYEIVQFDLRLLFLITACGASERVRCRDECSGIPIMINLLDAILFGPGQRITVSEALHYQKVGQASQGLVDDSVGVVEGNTHGGGRLGKASVADEESEECQSVRSKLVYSTELGNLAPMRGSVYCLPSPIDDKACIILHDALKILFNQTLGWAEKDCEGDDLVLCTHLAYLLRILLVSIPPVNTSKAAVQTIVHAIEVLVNIPEKCAYCLLIPPHAQVTQLLTKLYPKVMNCSGEEDRHSSSSRDCNDGGTSRLYRINLDQIHDDWNMAAIVSLLNFLDLKLCGQIERNSLSAVLTALRVLSKGHRNIRRFLKSEILPPLHEVKERPEVGDSLKSRLVRLMVAGSHGAEEVTAELLFVLCKENANRLVKHTGYGNAAGLLLAHGLLAGGVSQGSHDYSSDSETSDSEDYRQSESHIDPVTAGPIKEDPSPLDGMSAEEKEREAEELEGLLKKLDKHGIIKVIPLDEHNQPLKRAGESDSDTDGTD